MIKKMTNRAMNPEAKNLKERSAHRDLCINICEVMCKGDQYQQVIKHEALYIIP